MLIVIFSYYIIINIHEREENIRVQIIVDFIRVTEFVFYTYYIYKKMLDEKKNSVKNEILLSLLGVLVSILVAILRFYTNSIISTVILYFLLCILIERLTSQQGVYLKVLISLSICLATFVLSVMISYIFQFILHDIKYVICTDATFSLETNISNEHKIYEEIKNMV